MHPTLPDFNQLKKAVKQNLPATKTIRVALAADSASQFLCTSLQGYAALQGLKLDLYEAPYNQIGLQVFNPASELNDFKAKYIILFESSQHLQKHFYHTPLAERGDFAQHHLQQIGDYAEAAQRNGAKLIYYNFTDCNDGVFGNFATNYSRSFPAQLRLLNARLTEVASQHKNMFVVDLLSIQSRYGTSRHDRPQSIHTNRYGTGYRNIARSSQTYYGQHIGH
jgi:predicted enzyme involved in methoxymalonyl-ACP biosynthesis